MLPALAVLYTRLDASHVADSPPRRALLTILRGTPGLRVSDAARALGVDYKTALHHLRHLARAGHVQAAREGRGDRYYLPGAPRPPPAARERRVLRAVRAGASGPQAVARETSISRGTAGRLLGLLVARGLVAFHLGRAALTPAGERAFAGRGDEPFS